MTITSELNLANFNFWSGAKDRAKLFTYNELKEIENQLEDLYPNGMSETDINDLFWFEEDFLCEMIGITSADLYNRN